MQATIGPLIVDLHGSEIDPEEGEILQHPLVGGVVLFARNFVDYQQLQALCSAIHQTKNNLLIMVDQEGGRVQRFKQDFTRLPPLYALGILYKDDPELALHAAKECGWLMAYELLTAGITNSLAPVLDLYHKDSPVIGDRAFSDDLDVLISLSQLYREGMEEAGMKAVGKHFPGHGNVITDSHVAIPRDARSLESLEATDLKPFLVNIKKGLNAIMVAHIIFEKIDQHPPTYSPIWLKDLLRNKYDFRGVILSDDIHMEGANLCASYDQRFLKAREAGCDFVLLCNYRPGVIEILNHHQLGEHYVPPAIMEFLQPNIVSISNSSDERRLKAQSLIHNLLATQVTM